MPDLVIEDLEVESEGTELLSGLDLELPAGEIHAIMGPNGAGKSTLGYTLMGHPGYRVTDGEIIYGDKNILQLPAEERARAGLYLAFQYPPEIPGVTVSNFLKSALDSRSPEGEEFEVMEFRSKLKEKCELLDIPSSFINRSLNVDFSGGEKKRFEILQMALLEPSLALLDEVDSGLDIDALETVAEGIKRIKREIEPFSLLLITHYQRILDYIEPDRVHVLKEGRLMESGGPELARELEGRGYDWVGEEA